jgi:hypothetical protein
MLNYKYSLKNPIGLKRLSQIDRKAGLLYKRNPDYKLVGILYILFQL